MIIKSPSQMSNHRRDDSPVDQSADAVMENNLQEEVNMQETMVGMEVGESPVMEKNSALNEKISQVLEILGEDC